MTVSERNYGVPHEPPYEEPTESIGSIRQFVIKSVGWMLVELARIGERLDLLEDDNLIRNQAVDDVADRILREGGDELATP